MVRKINVAALTSHLEQLGFTLEKRVAGHFTELYSRLPFKRAIHAFHLVWFSKGCWPHLARQPSDFLQKDHPTTHALVVLPDWPSRFF